MTRAAPAPPDAPRVRRAEAAPVVHHRLRTAVLTGIVVELAVLGHTVGGGMPPGPAAVVAAVLLTWPLCARSAARRRRFPALLLLLGLAQPALHLLLTFVDPLLSGTTGGPSGHGEHAALALHATAGHAGPGMAGAHGVGPMLALHAVAALLTATVLAHGEQVLVRWARGARRVIDRLLRRPLVDVRHPAGPVLAAAVDAAGVLLTRSRPRRGPPALVAA